MKKGDDDSSDSDIAKPDATKPTPEDLGLDDSDSDADPNMLEKILGKASDDEKDENKSGSDVADYDKETLENLLQSGDEEGSDEDKETPKAKPSDSPLKKLEFKPTSISPGIESPTKAAYADPLVVVERYETRTKLEDRPKLVLHLEDNKVKMQVFFYNGCFRKLILLFLEEKNNRKINRVIIFLLHSEAREKQTCGTGRGSFSRLYLFIFFIIV